MKNAAFAPLLLAPLLLALGACSQTDAPSDQLEAAADELVDAVIESPAPGATPVLGKYEPRNECSDLAGADAFLAALGAAVELRDTDVLVALAANDVKLGFGGEDGSGRLRLALDAEGSVLWDELSQVITLGCDTNSQGGITMPWYFAQQTSLDPFESLIVTGKNVPMRAAAAADAEVLTQVSWEEVQMLRNDKGGFVTGGNPEDPEQSWTKVRLQGAAGSEPVEGFIRNSRLRSVVDYRLIASSRNGRWRITAMLAGD